MAVQWRRSPPFGPHGSTPQWTPSSSWQSHPGSSPRLAHLHHLCMIGSVCARVCVCVCVCVCVVCCVCVSVQGYTDACTCNLNSHSLNKLSNCNYTFEEFDSHCVRGFPFSCHIVYVSLGWCRGNIHGQGAFVDQTVVAFSKFGSYLELGA